MKSIKDIISESSSTNMNSWNIYSVAKSKDYDFDIDSKEGYVVINVGPDTPEIVFTYDPSDFDDELGHMNVGDTLKLNSNGNKGIIYRFR